MMWQVSLKFQAWMLSVYSTDAASTNLKMVSQIPHLMVPIGFRGLHLLARFFSKKCHLHFLVSDPWMLHHNFYCIFSCYLPSTKFGFGYLYSCSYTNMGCPLIEVSSFKGTRQNGCLPTHLRTETYPVSETLCSLVCRIPDNGQSKNRKKKRAILTLMSVAHSIPSL
jgi:hypothetical protein